MQHVYNLSIKGWSQVITGVEFNCMAITQGSHPDIHLI